MSSESEKSAETPEERAKRISRVRSEAGKMNRGIKRQRKHPPVEKVSIGVRKSDFLKLKKWGDENGHWTSVDAFSAMVSRVCEKEH